MDVDELRGLALFDGTDDEQLGELLAASMPVALRRHMHPEQRRAGPAPDADLAAVPVEDATRDAQPQPGSPTHALGAEERVLTRTSRMWSPRGNRVDETALSTRTGTRRIRPSLDARPDGT